jgi:dsDNA-specific endonuclease/ATPase MutS2
MIITGPNASGKTTILKSTLINIIFTQQFGCGFYEFADVAPFNHIHCYLNIPDTSGRDSLFQAEARRCKEILDIISTNKKETNFFGFTSFQILSFSKFCLRAVILQPFSHTYRQSLTIYFK